MNPFLSVGGDDDLDFWRRIHRRNLKNELFSIIRELRFLQDSADKPPMLTDEASDAVLLIDILLCNDVISLDGIKKAMRFLTDPSSDLTGSAYTLRKKVIEA